MISVFQTYFDEKSRAGLEEGFYPHFNKEDNDYFESYVMKQVYEMNPALKEGIKYLGVTSWKQSQKTHFTAKEILAAIQKDIDAGTEKDVYIYSPLQGVDIHTAPDGTFHGTIRQPNIYDWHPKRNIQIQKDEKLLNESGVLPFDLFDGKWQYCMVNYWIAKKEVFDEYCKTVLLPAIEFCERPDIKAQMPKFYRHSYNHKMYNSFCFIHEALFGSFLSHTNYSFKYLCRKKYRERLRDIVIDGYEMTNENKR